MTLGIVALVASMTIAQSAGARERILLAGAARHVALSFRAARAEAALSGRAVAIQFLDRVAGTRYRVVADGDGDGVRSSDIADGRDPVIGATRSLTDDYGGVRFAIGCDCPGIEGDEPLAAGTPGVRFGTSALATFAPGGTATAGTLYLSSGGATTYAVRVAGSTGRTRVLRYDPARQEWVPP